MENEAPLIFVSYAHADDDLRAAFETALSSLTRQGLALAWTDERILAGSPSDGSLFAALERAAVVVLLISPAFVKSQYCYELEMPKALHRHAGGTCIAIPVLVRPTPEWRNLPFAQVQVLPTRGLPVTNWANRDDAWSDVVQGIAEAIRFPERWPRAGARDSGRCTVFQVPDPDAVFVGRGTDVAGVSSLLRSDKRVIVIRGGLGGLGKTALAQQVAHSMRDHFTGGVLWGRLPGGADANSLITAMLASSDTLDRTDDVRLSTYEVAKRRLDAFCATEPVLIVLDNANTADDVLPFIPATGPARVLVTTRYGIADSLPNATVWHLEPLRDVAGQELLAGLLGGQAPDSPDAARLVSALGGLPLAIRIAAGNMRGIFHVCGRFPGPIRADQIAGLARNRGFPRDPPVLLHELRSLARSKLPTPVSSHGSLRARAGSSPVPDCGLRASGEECQLRSSRSKPPRLVQHQPGRCHLASTDERIPIRTAAKSAGVGFGSLTNRTGPSGRGNALGSPCGELLRPRERKWIRTLFMGWKLPCTSNKRAVRLKRRIAWKPSPMC